MKPPTPRWVSGKATADVASLELQLGYQQAQSCPVFPLMTYVRSRMG